MIWKIEVFPMILLGAWYVTLLAVLFVLVCLFMMLVILIQRPRGGGLAGAFGGAGGAVQQAFGSKVGDLLTAVTVGCFLVFLLLAILLTWSTRAEQEQLRQSLLRSESPASPAAPAGSASPQSPAPPPSSGSSSPEPVAPPASQSGGERPVP